MSNDLDAAAREVRRLFGDAGVIVADGSRWAVGAVEADGVRIFGRGAKLAGAVITAERTLGEIVEAAARLPGKRRGS